MEAYRAGPALVAEQLPGLPHVRPDVGHGGLEPASTTRPRRTRPSLSGGPPGRTDRRRGPPPASRAGRRAPTPAGRRPSHPVRSYVAERLVDTVLTCVAHLVRRLRLPAPGRRSRQGAAAAGGLQGGRGRPPPIAGPRRPVPRPVRALPGPRRPGRLRRLVHHPRQGARRSSWSGPRPRSSWRWPGSSWGWSSPCPWASWPRIRPRTWLDHVASIVSVVGQAVPTFWLGIMLILVFAVSLRAGAGLRPRRAGGASSCRRCASAVYLAPIMMRLVRSGMLTVLGQDYVRTARAKGIAEAADPVEARVQERQHPAGDHDRAPVRAAARRHGGHRDRLRLARHRLPDRQGGPDPRLPGRPGVGGRGRCRPSRSSTWPPTSSLATSIRASGMAEPRSPGAAPAGALAAYSTGRAGSAGVGG